MPLAELAGIGERLLDERIIGVIAVIGTVLQHHHVEIDTVEKSRSADQD